MTAIDRAVGVLGDAHDNGYADSAPIWLRGDGGPPFTIGDLRELIIAASGMEARRAAAENTDAVHDSPAPKGDAQ